MDPTTGTSQRHCLYKICIFVPSTISSESSKKNSLSGGLLGRFSVFNSCCIFVETLLLTGTPEETTKKACSQTPKDHTGNKKAHHAPTHTCKSVL